MEKLGDALIDRWVYDIRGILTRRLGGLIDDLRSEDDEISNCASQEAGDILNWLELPAPSISDMDRGIAIAALYRKGSLSPEERSRAIDQVARMPKRGRGRPRTDTTQHAIRALFLHLATPLTWDEIAMKVKGCKHVGAGPGCSCPECADALRDAVGRLAVFLKSKGLHPGLPRRKELAKHKWPSG